MYFVLSVFLWYCPHSLPVTVISITSCHMHLHLWLLDIRYLSQVTYVLCGIAEKAFWRTPHGRMQNSFSWPRITCRLRLDFCTIDYVFCTGYRCYNCNVYSNSEAQDSQPYQQGVMERLLSSARGPVAKMNGNVARLAAHQSWEDDDADHAWKKCTG